MNEILSGSGLFVRGGFHPGLEDDVPNLPGNVKAGSVVLLGNAGADMWHLFEKEADLTAQNPLDTWLGPKIEEAAQLVGAHCILPNSGPPFIPIQDWAMRAEPVFRSPIGIMVHSKFGLWHVYRAALLFSECLDLPDRATADSPCETCSGKPCIRVCPADAFLPESFDALACATHVEGAEGSTCRSRGCLARRACPVGRDYLYVPDQQKFHTSAMLRAVKVGYTGDTKIAETHVKN